MVDQGKGQEVTADTGVVAGAGALRYRVWPARRQPWRLLLVAVLALGAAVAVALSWENAWWAIIAALGISAAAAPFFFPTEVALDGARLVLRQLGTPRSYDLRQFRRVEVVADVITRAELSAGPDHSPLEAVQGVVVPLPSRERERMAVVAHLRRWAGRRATGQFAFDDDHAPEDEVVDEVGGEGTR